VRIRIQEILAAADERTLVASGHKQAQRAEAGENWEITKTAMRIKEVVEREPGISWSKLRRTKFSEKQRQHAPIALETALSEKWVVEKVEEGSGTRKRTLHPS
jgi:hypothetical protein